MKIVDTSPPNSSAFFPRHTGLLDVSELERRGSPHGSATVMIKRNHSETSSVFLASKATPRSRAEVATAPAVPLTVQDEDHSILSRAFDTSKKKKKRYTSHVLFQTAESRSQGSGQRSLMHGAAFSASGAACCCGLLASQVFDDRALSNCSFRPTSCIVVLELAAQIGHFSQSNDSLAIGLVSSEALVCPR